MSGAGSASPADWAAACLAIDPRLGGLLLRAGASPAREAFLAQAIAMSGRPARRLPVGASEDRVFGGLDLAATLAAGRPVHAAGLLSEIGTGTLVVPMAERLTPGIAARMAQAWDSGAEFAVVALDEGQDEDPAPPAALTDRLAFHVTLPLVAIKDAAKSTGFEPGNITAARRRLSGIVDAGNPAVVLTKTAAALGIMSARAPQLALRVARAISALDGSATTTQSAIERAAALVLAPRATRLPPIEDQQEDAPPPAETQTDAPEDTSKAAHQQQDRPPEDLVLEAAQAAIPADLLAQLAAQGALARGPQGASAGAGDDQKGAARGRPAGVRRGDPRNGARLDLVATLRTAAPWQALRKGLDGPADRVRVTPEDFRVKRFKQKREKVVIFVVDASGSAALTRLAETKGAIELMLAEAYVRREQVALIAFRGTGAELLLPPTRSLVQAKRRLSSLPGGGGTPLAAGLEAAALLVDQVRRRGQTPHVALLTDGRANIGRDGQPGRATAAADATAAARLLRANGVPALLVDTAPRPQDPARKLATILGALYLPMPRADARTLDRAMRAALTPAPGAAA